MTPDVPKTGNRLQITEKGRKWGEEVFSELSPEEREALLKPVAEKLNRLEAMSKHELEREILTAVGFQFPQDNQDENGSVG